MGEIKETYSLFIAQEGPRVRCEWWQSSRREPKRAGQDGGIMWSRAALLKLKPMAHFSKKLVMFRVTFPETAQFYFLLRTPEKPLICTYVCLINTGRLYNKNFF